MATIPEVEVVAGCDILAAAREQFVARWSATWPGVRVYEDYEKLFATEAIDIVSIVTPDHLHAGVLYAALESGVRAIFCEKPLSVDLDEADHMVEAVRAAGVPMNVNYGNRWLPQYVEARRLVRAGAIGNLAHVLVEHGGPRAMLWRMHTHNIDLMNFFAESEPAWVWAELELGMQDYGSSYKGDGGREASMEPGVNAYVAFENGVRGSLTGWKRVPQDTVVHLIGSLARIELDVEGWRLIETPTTTDRAPVSGLGNPFSVPLTPNWTVDGMASAIRELLRAVDAGGGPVTSPGETARRTVAITDAILRSQASGNIRVSVEGAPWGAAATAAAAAEGLVPAAR